PAEALLPDRSATVAIHTPEKQLAPVGDTQKDPVAPHDRCRAGKGWQPHLPGDVRRLRPPEWQIGLDADAVERRTTPLRPWVGSQGSDGERKEDNNQNLLHAHSPKRLRCESGAQSGL